MTTDHISRAPCSFSPKTLQDGSEALRATHQPDHHLDHYHYDDHFDLDHYDDDHFDLDHYDDHHHYRNDDDDDNTTKAIHVALTNQNQS